MRGAPRLDRSRLVALSTMLATSGLAMSGCDPVPAPVYGGPPVAVPVPSGSGVPPSASASPAPSTTGVVPAPQPAPEASRPPRIVKPVYGGPPIPRKQK
jgi:hypothetical protein